MSKKWSKRLIDKLAITLPEDISGWYDDELWREAAAGEYGQPVEPEAVLDVKSSTIRGGQMLPDTIPILTNGIGDVIALRFGFDGSVCELVEWHHVGMEWGPVGKTLTEALFYDAVRSHREMTLAGDDGADDDELFVFAEWAHGRQEPTNSGRSFQELICRYGIEEYSSVLLRKGIAEFAVHRDVAKAGLTTGLEKACIRMGGGLIAETAGVSWEELRQGLFDPTLIGKDLMLKLSDITGVSASELVAQNLKAASRAAKAVIEKRGDLAWPFAAAGWVAEKETDNTAAIDYYTRGLRALATTADFTSSWLQGPGSRIKFCVSRLEALHEDKPGLAKSDDYLEAALQSPNYENDTLPVREHWLASARELESNGEHRRAFQAYYAAGWDDAVSNDMAIILERLVFNAEAGGAPGLANITRLHSASIEDMETRAASHPIDGVRPWWKVW